MTLIYGLWTVDFIADKFHFPENSQVYKSCLDISEKLIKQCRKNLKLTYTVHGKEKLPCGDDGFEAMTFYNTLKKINEQIDLIEHEREQ